MATCAVARETVFALRREIARIEGTLPQRLDAPVLPPILPPGGEGGEGAENDVLLRHDGIAVRSQPGILLPTGSATLDEALGGGISHAALTEIHGGQTRDAGAVAGFALALATFAMKQALRPGGPLLWIAAGETLSEAGLPYGPGILHRFGIAAEGVMLVRTRKIEDALWAAEEAAALAAFSGVVLEVRGPSRRLDLTATRRLHRRTRAAGRPFYLLRQAGVAEPTAASVRFLVAPARAGERETLAGRLRGSLGPPAFTVMLTRSPTARPATVTLEWNRDERAFHERRHGRDASFRTQDIGALATLPADGADPALPVRQVVAFRGAA